MSDQEQGRRSPAPETPPGVAVPSGSPFADYSSDWSAPARGPAGPSTVNRRLARATQIGALVFGLANLVVAFFAYRALDGFEDWYDNAGAVDDWYDAHDAMNSAMNVSYLVGLVVLVPAILWSFQLTRSTRRHGVNDRRWTPGWAVGGWLIPFANLVIPFLVVRENERVAEAAANSRATMWIHARTHVVTVSWWLATVGGLAIASLGTTWTHIDDTIQVNFDETRRGYIAITCGSILVALGSALMISVVGRITRLDRVRPYDEQWATS